MRKESALIVICIIAASTFSVLTPKAHATSINIFLGSRKIDSSTQDLGTIIFEPEPTPYPIVPNLPRTISREIRALRYDAVYYPPSRHVIHHWEFSGGIYVVDAGMPLAGVYVYVNGPDSGTLIAVYEEVPATVHLESRKDDSSTTNLGTMDFAGALSLSLPSNIQRMVSGSPYQATYHAPPAHEFDHWETTDGIWVPNPNDGPTTDARASKNAHINANFGFAEKL